MFTVTRAAAKQIRRSAASSDTEELALRIAASRGGDGGIDYRMGFDDVGVDDTLLSTNGVDVVIAAADKELAQRYRARLRRIRSGRPPLHLPQPERSPPPPADRMNAARTGPAGRPHPARGPGIAFDRPAR